MIKQKNVGDMVALVQYIKIPYTADLNSLWCYFWYAGKTHNRRFLVVFEGASTLLTPKLPLAAFRTIWVSNKYCLTPPPPPSENNSKLPITVKASNFVILLGENIFCGKLLMVTPWFFLVLKSVQQWPRHWQNQFWPWTLLGSQKFIFSKGDEFRRLSPNFVTLYSFPS